MTYNQVPAPCICGFIYPRNPQGQWTEQEYKSVAAHQRFHEGQSMNKPVIPMERKKA